MSTIRAQKHNRSGSPFCWQESPSHSDVLAEHDLVLPPNVHALQGYRKWAQSSAFPARGRVFFLDKEIYIDMSPEELENHAKVKLEIGRVLSNFNKKGKQGELYPDGTLVTNLEANLSTEPDGTFVTWEALESGRVRLVAREGAHGEYIELEGTPDWVMEIVSRFSVRKDTKTLRDQYHRAEIPEYWLIDARGEKISFSILVWQESGYIPSRRKNGWQFSIVFGHWFRLTRRRERMGLWQYTLHLKRRV